MRESSKVIARRLAARAPEVCRRYLPKGKRVGGYWIAGDVRGAKGRSLYVRLAGPLSGKGAAGKWSDAATGEHGDLLDIIASTCRLSDHRDVLDEARRFLSLTSFGRTDDVNDERPPSPAAARRLFAASKPIAGTLAEAYLRGRGVNNVSGLDALRFHPRCFYRPDRDSPREQWPALIAAVTNGAGNLTGVQRTFLARDGSGKAPLPAPRKAIGALAGNAVRFGEAGEVMIVGEGIETVLSLRCLTPSTPLAAALSAQHLNAFRIPPKLKRLYIAADRDDAGMRAAELLRRRADDEGVNATILLPARNDFNDDLAHSARAALIASLRRQLAPLDREALHRAR
ncbi:MAG: toprim domain-containing protein [Amphiplicatus sp.]